MKKLFLKAIILCTLFVAFLTFDASAQKKKTYVKDVKLDVYMGCLDMSGDIGYGADESRISVKVNGNKMGVLGKDLDKALIGNGKDSYLTPVYLTEKGENFLYIGDFEPDEEFVILMDFWEDDIGGSFSFNAERNWKGDNDDELPDASYKALGNGEYNGLNFNNTCLSVKYIIYQE